MQKGWAAPNGFLLFAAFVLLVAIGSWDYGYYKAVRWVTCLTFAWSAIIAWHASFKKLVPLFIAIAILFNPLIPFHFNRPIWQVLDALVAVLAISLAWFGRNKNPTEKEHAERNENIGFAIAFSCMILGVMAGVAIGNALSIGETGKYALGFILGGAFLYLSGYLWVCFKPKRKINNHTDRTPQATCSPDTHPADRA